MNAVLHSILVVENEAVVALNLQHWLRKMGYVVPAIAASGEQALEFINIHRPNLVLMDINIDGALDGIDIAARISQAFSIPVIYLTAYSDDKTLERARETKPYGYLLKPFSERELYATVQMALERLKSDLALKDSEEHLRLALAAADMGSWELNVDSRKFLCMGASDTIFGFQSEIFSVTWDEFVGQVYCDDRTKVVAALEQAIADESGCEIEFRNRMNNGETRWLKVQGKVHAVPMALGERRVIGVVQNITERKNSEQKLRQAATVFSASTDGILVLDKNFHALSANASYCKMTGETLEQIIGQRPHQLDSKLVPAQSRDDILSAVEKKGIWSGELRGLRANGDHFPLLVTMAEVREDQEELTHYVVVFSDLTEVRNAEQQLYYLAHHDPLTGLPNRIVARDRLSTAISHALRRNGRLAVLFVDVDYFKRVNDTLGHEVGDELLRLVAQRITECVRKDDTVARLGGDEFMILLDRIERIEEVAIVAGKTFSCLKAPIVLQGHELNISASIGISLYPDDADNSDGLIRAADTAMYAAKGQGRNRYIFYTAAMTEAAARYMELDQHLRHALKNNELLLLYQPQVLLTTGEIVGVEALIRWQHPVKGLLGALDIIPIAEESGLIIDIGEWVLRRACEQAREWREAGLPKIRIAVNVSARQMQQDRLIPSIRKIFQDTEMPPAQLEIELTESTLQDEEGCIATLRELKNMGITLAIDDFGTGYSCLSSLKNLPIHRVKIDRAFVRDIPRDLNDVAITEAIIAMAHGLHLQVIAEGVETVEQEELLRSRGCDEVQGYLYAKPMTASALSEMMRKTGH